MRKITTFLCQQLGWLCEKESVCFGYWFAGDLPGKGIDAT